MKEIIVTLPAVAALPDEMHGRPYRLTNLLANGKSNPKLVKGWGDYRIWGLSLAPAKVSGYQLCASASAGCRKVCLNAQGRGQCTSTTVARIARAVAFHDHRIEFAAMLHRELSLVVAAARRGRFTAAVRPNVFSDVQWEKTLPAIFGEFSEIQFYDYTKHALRALRFAAGAGPRNYHLTFSRSECNEVEAGSVLQAGGNVAVVFRHFLPKRWMGKAVVDGTANDLRFLDPEGVVVGLLAKGTARGDRSGFVVDPARVRSALL